MKAPEYSYADELHARRSLYEILREFPEPLRNQMWADVQNRFDAEKGISLIRLHRLHIDDNEEQP